MLRRFLQVRSNIARIRFDTYIFERSSTLGEGVVVAEPRTCIGRYQNREETTALQ